MSKPEVPAEDGGPVSDQAEVQPGAVVAPAMPETPCAGCGRTRTEAEGGRIFTHCDECWPAAPATPDALKLLEEWLKGGKHRYVGCIDWPGRNDGWRVGLEEEDNDEAIYGHGPTLSAAILAALEATK